MEKEISFIDGSEQEKKLVSLEESRRLAEDLLERFNSAIQGQLQKDIDGWGEPYTDFQKSTRHFLETIPEDIKKRFQGHGIIRKSQVDQLSAALNILANKSIKGESGPLLRGGSVHEAFKDGDFLALSKIDKDLPLTEEQNGQQIPITNEIGWVADIGAFVVDTRYYSMIDELKDMFPDVKIIKANELPDYLQAKLGEDTTKSNEANNKVD